jgi:hypothetical protein
MGSGPIFRAASIALLVFAAGCASPYIDPSLDEASTEPTARLILKNRDGVATFRGFDDGAGCRKPHVIAAAAALQAGEDDEADIGVVAGKDFSLAAQQVVADGKTGCLAIATFRPMAGQRYLATFQARDAACSLVITRILSAVPPRIGVEPSFRVRRAATADGASCEGE